MRNKLGTCKIRRLRWIQRFSVSSVCLVAFNTKHGQEQSVTLFSIREHSCDVLFRSLQDMNALCNLSLHEFTFCESDAENIVDICTTSDG